MSLVYSFSFYGAVWVCLWRQLQATTDLNTSTNTVLPPGQYHGSNDGFTTGLGPPSPTISSKIYRLILNILKKFWSVDRRLYHQKMFHHSKAPKSQLHSTDWRNNDQGYIILYTCRPKSKIKPSKIFGGTLTSESLLNLFNFCYIF